MQKGLRAFTHVFLVMLVVGALVVINTKRVAMAATIGGDASTAANCPPDVQCEVDLAALKDGGCNWSTAKRPSDLPVYGITEHTTEGSLAEALAEAQDTSKCISWNYLIDQTGKVYVSVPKDSLAYDVGNWWVNTHYVQVEHVGRAEDCSTLTPAEYAASIKLDHWLIRQFRIQPSSATIAGHDSYPAVNDAGMASRHWDPGICWPWATYLAAVGAPIVPTAAPNAPVVTIKAKDSHQSVQDCPGVGFSGCVAAAQDTTNFLALHTAPSAASPLLADPYLHPDGSSGSTAMQDWGDKAPTGHAYVVLARKAGWTEIQYGGTNAWFQDTGKFTVPTTALVVRPKANQAVPIYGRPMPEYDAPGWQSIPYDHQQQVALTKYMMQPGQRYVVASVPQPRTDYAEGCNLADCSGPGDMTVVIGNEKYYEISWSHHYAFVKAADVAVTPAR